MEETHLGRAEREGEASNLTLEAERQEGKGISSGPRLPMPARAKLWKEG